MLLPLVVLFIIFTIVVNSYPIITLWDRMFITQLQGALVVFPTFVPTALDGMLYSLMIALPLFIAWIYFFIKKKYFDMVYFSLVPLLTYSISHVLKHIIERPRPPVEFYLSVIPDGYSYVSNHTVITFCLWGMVIYYFVNYCENKLLRNIAIAIASIWMALIGFSRVWLGVHNPTDVLAAYLLGAILLIIFIRVRKFIEKYIGL